MNKLKMKLLSFISLLNYKRLSFYSFLFNLKLVKFLVKSFKLNIYFFLRFLLLILSFFVFLLKFEFQYLLLLFLCYLMILFIEYSYKINKIDFNSYVLFALAIISFLIVLIFFFDILLAT